MQVDKIFKILHEQDIEFQTIISICVENISNLF